MWWTINRNTKQILLVVKKFPLVLLKKGQIISSNGLLRLSNEQSDWPPCRICQSGLRHCQSGLAHCRFPPSTCPQSPQPVGHTSTLHWLPLSLKSPRKCNMIWRFIWWYFFFFFAKKSFGINFNFLTASSASVRTSLFTTVEAAAKERMEANAARTRRRWDNIIPLQKFYISLHLQTQIRPLSLSGGWSGLMVRHFPTSLNDPAPPKLSQDILEIPYAKNLNQHTLSIWLWEKSRLVVFIPRTIDTFCWFCRLNYALYGLCFCHRQRWRPLAGGKQLIDPPLEQTANLASYVWKGTLL